MVIQTYAIIVSIDYQLLVRMKNIKVFGFDTVSVS